MLLAGFEHRPGVHCGSTAMADVFRHQGHDLSEAMCFGLGAGLGLAYLRLGMPSRVFHGRTRTMEEELCRALGAAFRTLTEPDPDAAWDRVRARLDAGGTVVLQCDVRFLPHYKSSLPFNGHRVVLCGYQPDGTALVADTQFPGVLPVPQADLRAARASDGPPLGYSANLWWEIDAPAALPDLHAAARAAYRRAGAALLDDASATFGLRALADFAGELPTWGALPDAKLCAHFAYQVIERRGTGGGLFRRLYHQFLLESDAPAPLVATALACADQWTAIAECFRRAAAEPVSNFAPAAAVAARLVTLERQLAEQLAAA